MTPSPRCRSVERKCTLRFRTAEEFVEFFRRWYGPTLKAFEALDEAGQAALSQLTWPTSPAVRPQR